MSRFAAASEEDIQRDINDRVAANTRKKAKWAFGLLQTWYLDWKNRNTQEEGSISLEEMNKDDLNRYLRIFCSEVRKPKHALYQIYEDKEISFDLPM